MSGDVHLCFLHKCDPELQVVVRALQEMDISADRLVLVAINDPLDERDLGRQFSDRSFVGLRLSEKVERVALADAESRCQGMLAAGSAQANEKTAQVSTAYVEGPLIESAQRVVIEHAPHRIYVPTPPKRLLSRLLKGRSIDSLAKSLGTDVVIVD